MIPFVASTSPIGRSGCSYRATIRSVDSRINPPTFLSSGTWLQLIMLHQRRIRLRSAPRYFQEWDRINHIKLLTIVEKAPKSWKGRRGLITKLFEEIEIDPQDTYAIICGPPVMFKFVCRHLDGLGMPMNRMFVSLERRMHCGMGKCCRCMVGSTFTCVEAAWAGA